MDELTLQQEAEHWQQQINNLIQAKESLPPMVKAMIGGNEAIQQAEQMGIDLNNFLEKVKNG